MNTVSLSGLHILPDDLGSEFLVTGVRPFYLYENGERTDKIGGYKYMTVLPPRDSQGGCESRWFPAPGCVSR